MCFFPAVDNDLLEAIHHGPLIGRPRQIESRLEIGLGKEQVVCCASFPALWVGDFREWSYLLSRRRFRIDDGSIASRSTVSVVARQTSFAGVRFEFGSDFKQVFIRETAEKVF